MCGIAGITGPHVDRGRLAAMATSLVHRGPDDEGFFVADGIGLAFRRLSIVDLEGGRQPMANEDGRVRVVFNGEIYNHPDLRDELQRAGHRFATDHSDTEVLVHGWEEWGYELLPRLNGMFAAAIWDERSRELILARDRFGIKPIYYAEVPGGLVFGSEIRAIHASGLLDRRPSPEGIVQYFSFQNVWGEDTMFLGIRQLEAACILTWRPEGLSRRRYWDIAFRRSRRGTLQEMADEHRSILRRAVRRQLAADVPVMSYLSGGIDSTSITVAAARDDPQVTAYSCIFDLDGVGEDGVVDERAFSRSVAQAYGLRRVELALPSDSLRSCLFDYVSALEDLRMGMGYPVYRIAERVSRDAKVVLSGTGGDEFHAGYVGRYQALGLGSEAVGFGSWRGRLRRLASGVLQGRPPIAAAASPEPGYRRMLNFLLTVDDLARAFEPGFLAEARGFSADAAMDRLFRQCPSDDWRDRVMYVDARTYLVGLLVLEDKLSMASSLETRVPLLDNELVDFVLDLPFDVLCRGGTGKIVFRESVRPWVPEAIYRKPKMGFGPPEASWYRGALRPWIEEMLSVDRCRRRGVLRPEFVSGVLHEHFSGARDRSYLIWSLLNFEAWCDVFGMYGSRPVGTAAMAQA
jgi:asparagine synthase (glutamine-hydrolysing)